MKKMVKSVLLILVLLSGTVQAVLAADNNLVIKGSTTVLPIAQAAVDAYIKSHRNVQVSLSGGGSGDGIKALIDGSTDIADSSREIKKDEIELAKSKGVNPVATVIAHDALTPVIHPTNNLKGLTIDQLSQIYQGNITNWQQVGGADWPIVVVSRDSSSGTFESWAEFVMKKARVTPRAQMLASNGAVYTAVSKNKYAIAYLGLGYVHKGVKALLVNGVAASVETAVTKKYPLSRELYMYTNGDPKGEAAKFLAFIKSAAGQAIVVKEGFVPLALPPRAKQGK